MPDLHSVLRPPYIYLILGFIFIFAAVASTCAGKTFGRYGSWAYRIKERTEFWWGVVLYFLGGVLCIGTFLYKIYGLSN
jgi:hypothetical protein